MEYFDLFIYFFENSAIHFSVVFLLNSRHQAWVAAKSPTFKFLNIYTKLFILQNIYKYSYLLSMYIFIIHCPIFSSFFYKCTIFEMTVEYCGTFHSFIYSYADFLAFIMAKIF